MRLKNHAIFMSVATFLISGCNFDGLSPVKKVSSFSNAIRLQNDSTVEERISKKLVPISRIIETAPADVNLSSGFLSAVQEAVKTDPSIKSDQRLLSSKLARISITEAKKDFKLQGTIYAGVEDVTDGTSGLAAVLNMNRIIFDGGRIEATLAAQTFDLESSRLLLEAKKNERAGALTELWIDLRRYKHLNVEVENRLTILGPLITQLKRVAEAGLGDVTRVSAAQRTVSGIEATRTEISEKLKKAELDFVNAFGSLPSEIDFNSSIITSAVPKNITDAIIQKSPALMAAYMSYQSSEAKLVATEAKDSYQIGLESKLQRPFGDSGYDSDEQIGVVVRKTFYDGKSLKFEIDEAAEDVEAQKLRFQTAFREGDRLIRSAYQTIDSMRTAIALSNKTRADMEEEIAYLKRQLVIGGSTLDNVLSAEARLYQVLAKQINYDAERLKSEVIILKSLGLLTPLLDL